MNRFLKLALSVGFAVVVVLGAGKAHAYVWSQCSGSAVRWQTFYPIMTRDRCSMPNNTDAAWAYWEGGSNWWSIANVFDWGYSYDSGCTITHGDGVNQTAITTRASINNANGVTHTITNGCHWPYYDEHIVETDVLLANDMQYSPEDESFWNWDYHRQGRAVVIHEFGHALGLKHSEGFDVMRTYTPAPIAGGNTSEPYPDDAAGARALYPYSYSVNVFASAQKISSTGVSATDSSITKNVCRHEAINVTYSVVNSGASYISGTGFRVFVNNGPNNYTGGWNMLTATATIPPQTYFTETQSLRVPSIPPGLYWILWQVDTNNTTAEYNEWDNAVHSAMTLNIMDCWLP